MTAAIAGELAVAFFLTRGFSRFVGKDSRARRSVITQFSLVITKPAFFAKILHVGAIRISLFTLFVSIAS